MEYGSTWLQQQHLHDVHSLHPGANSPPAQEWKDPSSSSAGAGSSAGQQHTIDLSEFLGDIPGQPSSSPPVSNAQSSYYSYPPQQPYFHSNGPGPYNAVSYGAQSWMGSQSSQIPLSSYSSLNGATSSSTPSTSLQTSVSSAMVIDPALTTTNGASSPTTQYSMPSYLSQQRPQYSYQHTAHSPALSINPSFVHTTPSHFQHQQHPSRPQHSTQQQGTLSPYVLQTPNTALLSPSPAIPSSSFYASPQPSVPAPTPEQRKEKFSGDLKPLLLPTSFTGAGAVSQLASQIVDYGVQEVDPPTRWEILTKIRDNAGNHYFRAWVENEDAMTVTREWLKLAYNGKDNAQLVETIMPLLHIIDRLPLTIETLKTSKLGRIVVRLVKEPPAPAIKDMASNLERKWRQLISSNDDAKRPEDIQDTKGKKRKADVTSAKVGPPPKKAAPSVTTSAAKIVPIKKEVKPTTKEVKDAKSDSSFFSAPKPKPKLPSFKKAPPPTVKKEPDTNVAQPSSVNPFEEALKAMGKHREIAPASTPPATSTLSISGKQAKKRKSVTWAPDDRLTAVKVIERALYDDDPIDGVHATHNIRDLDRDEGAALHAHLFEEQIDWSEPQFIEFPPDIEVTNRGKDSQEKARQEEREQTALGALYMSAAQIPDSPGEPSHLPDDPIDEDVRMMLTGPEADAVFWNDGAPAVLETAAGISSTSVAELVGQLAANSDVPLANGATDGQGLIDFSVLSSVHGLSNLNAEQIQQIMQLLPGPSQAGADQSWNSYTEYGYGDDAGRDRRWSGEEGWDHGRGRGRGGRGRGRGDGGGFRHNKRKPCTFFAAGRCRYGDQCDFSHDPTP